MDELNKIIGAGFGLREVGIGVGYWIYTLVC